MNKILIATKNKDKFRIVSSLLKTSVFDKYDFYCLADLDEEILDREETGDVINRSFEKAENIFNNIQNNDFDYIIGVDDGIKIKNRIVENVKNYIQSIIDDKLLSKDEIVYIVRAYTFFNKTGDYYSVLTEIPFKYKKLEHDFEIKENSYPLSHVLTPINSDIPVSLQNFEESNEYYSVYSSDKFREAIDKLND